MFGLVVNVCRTQMQGSRDWNRKDMSDSMIGQLQNAYNSKIEGFFVLGCDFGLS